jgi:hypothetical protein
MRSIAVARDFDRFRGCLRDCAEMFLIADQRFRDLAWRDRSVVRRRVPKTPALLGYR